MVEKRREQKSEGGFVREVLVSTTPGKPGENRKSHSELDMKFIRGGGKERRELIEPKSAVGEKGFWRLEGRPGKRGGLSNRGKVRTFIRGSFW